MLISLIAILVALGYFVYPFHFFWMRYTVKYLVGCFCVWAAFFFAEPAVDLYVIELSGKVFLFLSAVIICIDLFAAIAVWLWDKISAVLFRVPKLSPYLMEIGVAMERMAAKKVGALIILQRKQSLRPYMKGGMAFDGEIKAEILVPLFLTTSPVHDGALVVNKGRIQTVKGILPLAALGDLAPSFGTRHRAAIGITEKTDAIALVVSEERGQISIASRGSLVHISDLNEYRRVLNWLLKGRSALALRNAQFIVTAKVLEETL